MLNVLLPVTLLLIDPMTNVYVVMQCYVELFRWLWLFVHASVHQLSQPIPVQCFPGETFHLFEMMDPKLDESVYHYHPNEMVCLCDKRNSHDI